MKKFLLIFIVIFTALAGIAAAQPAKLDIVPEKKVYKRTGKDVPDFKQSFEVRKPVIKTKLDADVRSHIEDAIDFWRVFEMDLNESLTDYTWLENFDYEVKYNDNHILSIALFAEGSAAYPSSGTRWVTVDTRTGEILLIDDLFAEEKRNGLLKLINAKMIANEAAAIKEDPEVKEALRDQRVSYGEDIQPGAGKLDLDSLAGFFITDTGVTFVYDYGFPHVIQALEPDGSYEFTFKEIKPFVASGSLLETLVR
jgi:hypothetical protein